jgi:hypothetical protein
MAPRRLLHPLAMVEQSTEGGHGCRWGGLRTWPTVRPTPIRLFLHGLGDMGL